MNTEDIVSACGWTELWLNRVIALCLPVYVKMNVTWLLLTVVLKIVVQISDNNENQGVDSHSGNKMGLFCPELLQGFHFQHGKVWVGAWGELESGGRGSVDPVLHVFQSLSGSSGHGGSLSSLSPRSPTSAPRCPAWPSAPWETSSKS
jgi:hypothetical protein